MTSLSKDVSTLLPTNAVEELDLLEGDDGEDDSASSSSSSTSSSSSSNRSDEGDRHYHKGAERIEGKTYQSHSHGTVATQPDEDDFSSEGDGPDDASLGTDTDVDDDVAVVPRYGGKQEKVGVESKSLMSISSKSLASTTNPVSSKSINSLSSQSQSSSSTAASKGVEDYKALQEQLRKSLETEKRLLMLQQQFILELENLEQSIIKVESEERIARLAIQQAQVIRLMQNKGEAGDGEAITIIVPS